MPTVSECPKADVLERMVLGQSSREETDVLEAHLLNCAHCVQTLKGLQPRDSLTDAMKEARTLPPTPEAADAMIPWLKHLCPSANDSDKTVGPSEPPLPSADAVTQTIRQGDAPGAAGDPEATLPNYDFLASPQQPDELGRLKNYRVLKTIGAGGMGMVFLAEDVLLKRQVALKVVKPELLQRQELRDRFLKEAQAIARVEHDNIVAIFHAEEANGIPYLVMPLLHGESLESYLDAKPGPLPTAEFLSISKEIAAGLAAAHDRGMIHRDIKPSNVWLETKDEGRRMKDEKMQSDSSFILLPSSFRVKILDFGLSRSIEAVDEDGQQKSILGTPAYMSPEQASCQNVDARTDLFSLGCVMYRMATGRMPFQGHDIVATLFSVATQEPTSPGVINPRLPGHLVRLIEKLLAKKADDRCATAHEVIAEIDRIQRQLQPRKLMRWLLVTAACVALAIGGTFAVVANRPPPPEEPIAVTFEFDEPDRELIVQRGDDPPQVISVAADARHMLLPGAYIVRPRNPDEKRKLVPDHFTVNPEEARTVSFRLVGLVRTFDGHSPPVAFAPQRDWFLTLSSSADRSLYLGSTQANANPLKLTDDGGTLTITHCIAFSPDGKRAISGSGSKGAEAVRNPDNKVRLWDLEKRACTHRLSGHESPVSAVAFDPRGRTFLSGDMDGIILFWSAKSLQMLDLADAHDKEAVHGLAYLPDGKQALSCGDTRLILWDVASPGRKKIFSGHKGSVRGLAVAPDGKHAATVSLDRTLRVWDLATGSGKVLQTLDCGINAVAYSPDGSRLLTGDKNGNVKLWQADTGALIEAFAGHHGKQVASVAFSKDGRRAISAGADSVLCLWDLPIST